MKVALACEAASFWRENVLSTLSFSANVVVAETSYQMLEVLSFCEGTALNSFFSKGNCTNFLDEKMQ